MAPAPSGQNVIDLTRDFFALSAPAAGKFLARHRVYDVLTQELRDSLTRKATYNSSIGTPTIRVVTKACELIQELLTLRVNAEIFSAPKEKIRVPHPIHSFRLPCGGPGVDIPLPSRFSPTAKVVEGPRDNPWGVDYKLCLEGVFSGNWQVLVKSGALGRRIRQELEELWSRDTAILIGSGEDAFVSISTLIAARASDQVMSAEQWLVYPGYANQVTKWLFKQLSIAVKDGTTLTRLDGSCVDNPRDFYDVRSVQESIEPEQMRVLAHKCVLAFALPFYRQNNQATKALLQALILATKTHHRKAAEAVKETLRINYLLLPDESRVKIAGDHVFHAVASSAVSVCAQSLVKSLDGLEVNAV